MWNECHLVMVSTCQVFEGCRFWWSAGRIMSRQGTAVSLGPPVTTFTMVRSTAVTGAHPMVTDKTRIQVDLGPVSQSAHEKV